MKNNNDPVIIYMSKQVSIYSAGIGTLILLCFLISRADGLMFLGLTYIFFALIINSVFFLILLFECFRSKEYWRKIVATMLFMLCNIPLSLLYCFLALTINSNFNNL
ncbi:hypothetical protein [Pedobacter nototheniae]|uniref:hypothetical protein n=1 Tax=Pedobacter nototheniae TaxID=2488994 RepID=UPI00103CD7D5|nr:hypothetical protein [Pedobacter nototheniae]